MPLPLSILSRAIFPRLYAGTIFPDYTEATLTAFFGFACFSSCPLRQPPRSPRCHLPATCCSLYCRHLALSDFLRFVSVCSGRRLGVPVTFDLPASFNSGFLPADFTSIYTILRDFIIFLHIFLPYGVCR